MSVVVLATIVISVASIVLSLMSFYYRKKADQFWQEVAELRREKKER